MLRTSDTAGARQVTSESAYFVSAGAGILILGSLFRVTFQRRQITTERIVTCQEFVRRKTNSA